LCRVESRPPFLSQVRKRWVAPRNTGLQATRLIKWLKRPEVNANLVILSVAGNLLLIAGVSRPHSTKAIFLPSKTNWDDEGITRYVVCRTQQLINCQRKLTSPLYLACDYASIVGSEGDVASPNAMHSRAFTVTFSLDVPPTPNPSFPYRLYIRETSTTTWPVGLLFHRRDLSVHQ
jgi:hypothetical protein